MARNIMHDHRVSEAREQTVVGYFRPGRTLQEAITRYWKAEVRDSWFPEFLDRKANGNNLLSGPVRDIWLVRVMDLNRLAPVYAWAKQQGMPEFEFFPENATQREDAGRGTEEVRNWLTAELRADRDGFLRAVFHALYQKRQQVAFQPAWVTLWDCLEPFVDLGANRWLEVLGIADYSPVPHLVILLKYRWRRAGTPIRPTVLDAGWNARHFPSPPQAPLEVGGHPMDLRTLPRADKLLSELIHAEATYTLQDWIEAGRRLEETTPSTPGSVIEQREAHHDLLAAKYGPGVKQWMEKCH